MRCIVQYHWLSRNSSNNIHFFTNTIVISLAEQDKIEW
jgi:hypothetical protein